MKKIILPLIFISLLIPGFIKAQDIIRTKTDTIEAKVEEIGLDEIKYKDFKNLQGPVYVIEKSSVIEITYENGTKFLVKQDPYDVNQEVKVRNKTHSIKFEFFSPLQNKLTFGYESMLKVGMNLEFKIGIIGAGFNGESNRDASGAFFKAGVKFLTNQSSTIQNGVKYAHGLKGFYIKPEVIFNSFKETYEYYNGSVYNKSEFTNTNYCLNIVFGKQYILGNTFTLDYYLGIGYGIHESNAPDYNSGNPYYNDDYFDEYQYSHLYTSSNSPMLWTAGMTIGVLF